MLPETDLCPLAIPENILALLVNELWENPSSAQKLELIQDEDAKCSLKAYRNTINFLKTEMNGTDYEEILLVLHAKGWKAAFGQMRSIYKEKRKKSISTTSQYRLYESLASFLKREFYAYIGYDATHPLSPEAFFALQEKGEAKLAQEMSMSSADAAGNLVFLSRDRLRIEEIAELLEQVEHLDFIGTLKHIESLTKARKY